MKIKHLVLSCLVAILLFSCRHKGPIELLEGSWSCTSYRVNGVEMLNSSPQTTNIVNTYDADGNGTIMTDADTTIISYIVDFQRLVHYSATDTLDHEIHQLSENNLRISVVDITILYEGVYQKQ